MDVTDNAMYECRARSQVNEERASASLTVDGITKNNAFLDFMKIIKFILRRSSL